ncbi:MAG: ankyrin repeat domain-containing protein [Blastocatellia bacterium]|nr:ankyrin repeat domain-containing protein [Blastocatellia bacterium]
MELKNARASKSLLLIQLLLMVGFGFSACFNQPTPPQYPRKAPIQLKPNEKNKGNRCKLWQYYTPDEEKTEIYQYCYQLQEKLCDSASKGDLTAVKEALRDGAHVDAIYFNHFPALHSAAAEGYKEVVLLLLDNGADVNTVANFLNTPLSLAAKRGHTEIVRILIERGADVCFTTDEGTLDQMAQKKGHPEIAEILKTTRQKAQCKDK